MRLVVVDTAQIQSYVFGSNRLRENIGASHLVAWATEEGGCGALDRCGFRHNARKGADGRRRLDDGLVIEREDVDAEVLYAGGGNFAVLFRREGSADKFVRHLSRQALEAAPGLRLVFGESNCDWDRPGSLAEAVDAAFQDAARQKCAAPPSAPLLGLGVTMTCRSTGFPAVATARAVPDEEPFPASAEILAKLDAVEEANERLRTLLPPSEDYDYPLRFEDLGGTRHEASYVAVVHADGDGMTERVRNIGRDHLKSPNRDYVKALRGFSRAVTEAASNALRQTLDALVGRIEVKNGSRVIVHAPAGRELAEITLAQGNGRFYLPFRPLVFGGDDVTFVCDGRLGLSLAVTYLRRFEEASEDVPGGRLTASAGVAIIKSHYPFARAYALAEDLCRSAKGYRRKTQGGGSFLDWHFALTGLAGGLEEIRKREFATDEGNLTLRPVSLGDNPNDGWFRSWRVVRAAIDAFQGEDWAGRRNKVKMLRTALRQGPEAVKRFLEVYGIKNLPQITEDYPDFCERGWWGGYCGYFDAVEMADDFIPVGDVPEEGRESGAL